LRTRIELNAEEGKVKKLKRFSHPKTPGTIAVQTHRPRLNKLTELQRRQLRRRAARLLYENEAPAPGRWP
jgi:hypothetical protein